MPRYLKDASLLTFLLLTHYLLQIHDIVIADDGCPLFDIIEEDIADNRDSAERASCGGNTAGPEMAPFPAEDRTERDADLTPELSGTPEIGDTSNILTADSPEMPAHPTEDSPEMPAHPTEDSPEVPARPTKDSPEVSARSTEDSPKVPARPTVDSPEVPARPTKDSPEVPARSTEDSPEVPARRTADSPEVPARPTADSPEVPARPTKDSPEVSARFTEDSPELPACSHRHAQVPSVQTARNITGKLGMMAKRARSARLYAQAPSDLLRLQEQVDQLLRTLDNMSGSSVITRETTTETGERSSEDEHALYCLVNDHTYGSMYYSRHGQ